MDTSNDIFYPDDYAPKISIERFDSSLTESENRIILLLSRKPLSVKQLRRRLFFRFPLKGSVELDVDYLDDRELITLLTQDELNAFNKHLDPNSLPNDTCEDSDKYWLTRSGRVYLELMRQQKFDIRRDFLLACISSVLGGISGCLIGLLLK